MYCVVFLLKAYPHMAGGHLFKTKKGNRVVPHNYFKLGGLCPPRPARLKSLPLPPLLASACLAGLTPHPPTPGLGPPPGGGGPGVGGWG